MISVGSTQSVPVLTAGSGASWETDLVALLENDPRIQVVRRCVDVADLVATAAAGRAQAALVSADLRRLDRDVVARLEDAGVAVLGVARTDDDAARQHLSLLGVRAVIATDAQPDSIAAAVAAAITAPARNTSLAFGSPRRDRGRVEAGARTSDGAESPERSSARIPGRLVAIWGPTGAPGRTTVSVNVAAELAAHGSDTLLIDADPYGGVIAQALGLLDEAPGLAAACRAASTGSLTVSGLAQQARMVDQNLRVLTGIARAERWNEVRPSALEVVFEQAQRLSDVTVVDTGFSLEQDEELAYDTAAPRRNGATLTTLALADVIVIVGAADPVGLQRLVRGLADLGEVGSGARQVVVVNRVRKSAVGPDPERQIRQALRRYAAIDAVVMIPDHRVSVDTALLQGRTLREAVPNSAVRKAMIGVAAAVAEDASVLTSTSARRNWRENRAGRWRGRGSSMAMRVGKNSSARESATP